MIHLKNERYLPKDASAILKKSDQLTEELEPVIRDVRVSKKYVELDVSINKQHLESLLEKLEPIGKIDHARHLVEETMDKGESLEKAKFYFNDERFWECHEVLEGVWKTTYEGEKDLVQGIILVAAALVHYQKYENEICLSIMKRAMEKLSNATGVYHEIDVDFIKNRLSYMINTGNLETFTI